MSPHDYVHHGTTSLFAAFNTADGTVISSIHRRHRAIELPSCSTSPAPRCTGQSNDSSQQDYSGPATGRQRKHPRSRSSRRPPSPPTARCRTSRRRPKAICIAGFLVVVAVGVNPSNALGLDGALKSLAAAPCALCSSSSAASASSLTASTLSPGPASPGSEYSTIGRVTTGERHPALRVRRAADPRTCSG